MVNLQNLKPFYVVMREPIKQPLTGEISFLETTYTSPFSDIAAVWCSPHETLTIFTSSGASSRNLA
jgi:hypothetical protein